MLCPLGAILRSKIIWHVVLTIFFSERLKTFRFLLLLDLFIYLFIYLSIIML